MFCRYLVQGLPNKRIATKLAISVPVVKKHVSDLLAHFHVVSRTHLVALMAQKGRAVRTAGGERSAG